jgi:hypothetical protein
MEPRELVNKIKATNSLLNSYLQDAAESSITCDVSLIRSSMVGSPDHSIIVINNFAQRF